MTVLVSAGFAQPMSAEARLTVLDVVVRVVAYDWEEEIVVGRGSGTVISEYGHILTNYHVVVDQAGKPLDLLPIFTAESSTPDLAPTLSYFAYFLEGDPKADIALLQVVADADGNALAAAHRFRHARLGSIDLLLIGDPISVVGYPGVSGDTITFTSGVVSGFLGEDRISSGRSWIKTDARVARGSSGGGAFDIRGTLVGVPTVRFSLTAPDVVETQELLRPIDLALPMLQRHIANIAFADPSVAPASSAAAGLHPPEPEPEGPTSEITPAASSWVISGMLDDSAEPYFSGRFAHLHRVGLSVGEPVHVRLYSREFDSYLVVLDPDGNVVLEVDDSDGAGLNVDEIFDPDTQGAYTFVVTSAYRRERGHYTLEVMGAITTVPNLESPAVAAPPVADVADESVAPTPFVFTGMWTGTIVDSYAGHGTVTVSMHQEGATLFGTWHSTFASGGNSGTLTGLLQSDGVYLELSPSDPSSCPFRGVVQQVGTTIGGTYVAFDCAIPISGTISVTKR